MHDNNIAPILVRAFGVILFLYSLRLVPEAYLIFQSQSNGAGLVFASVIPLSFFLASYLLVKFPGILASKIISSNQPADIKKIDSCRGLLDVFLLGIGMAYLFYGLVDLVYWAQVIFVSSKLYSGVSIALNNEQKIGMATTCIEVILSLLLIYYYRPISYFLLRKRADNKSK